jgi:hypothetical protein
MNGGSKPATRADLDATTVALREEIAASKDELRQEIAASKDELRQEIAASKDELRQEIAANRGEIAGLRADLHGIDLKIASAMNFVAERFSVQFAAFRNDMLREMARMTAANSEQNRREIGVVDEQYRDLPGRVSTLERELDEHRRDALVHRQPRRRSK